MTASPAQKRRFSFLPGLIFALLLLIGCVLHLERNLTQVILSLANARARTLAVQALNEAVEETIRDGVSYDELMIVQTGADGAVRLIQANTAAMNRLASQASLKAQKRLESLENQSISVPLGSALGLTLFAGAGPRFRVQVLPVGAVGARFETEFQSAGINQTRHKVLLNLEADVQLVIPTGAASVAVSTQVAVAESIIVGQVPDSFVDVNNDSDMLNLVP